MRYLVTHTASGEQWLVNAHDEERAKTLVFEAKKSSSKYAISKLSARIAA